MLPMTTSTISCKVRFTIEFTTKAHCDTPREELHCEIAARLSEVYVASYYHRCMFFMRDVQAQDAAAAEKKKSTAGR